jgi:periplasmic protein CpxP/Spy
MISFTRPTFRGISAAATLLGALVLVGPSFAASPQQLASNSSSTSMSSSVQEAPGPARVEARIKELHSKLHITDAQEKQWNDLTEVMRDNARAMVAIEKKRSR